MKTKHPLALCARDCNCRSGFIVRITVGNPSLPTSLTILMKIELDYSNSTVIDINHKFYDLLKLNLSNVFDFKSI
jgi:hypothetical protein